MGGIGSGPRARISNYVENTCRIDLRQMNRDWVLCSGASGVLSWVGRIRNEKGALEWRMRSSGIKLKWPVSGNLNYTQFVEMTTTLPNFGGERWWFLCPECSRRRLVLYLATVNRFYCRDCLKLTYYSKLQDAYGRAICRRDKAEEALKRALLAPCSYRRRALLRSRHMYLRAQANGLLAKKFGVEAPRVNE